VRVTRREPFVTWFFGSRREAHRVRDSISAYLIVVAWGFFWVGVHDIPHLAWWRQLGTIALFSFLPYVLLRSVLSDREEERHRRDDE
jgi:hypothetical protein